MTDFRELINSYQNCACGMEHRCDIKDIRVGSGLVHQVGQILRENGFPEKILLVADRKTLEAADGIVESLEGFQVEKYIYTLNHGGSSAESKLQHDLAEELPEGMTVRIANPQGMLLMGRSNNLSSDQLLDLEIIKRQYKNVVDIMTYDDLLSRLRNIMKQLES